MNWKVPAIQKIIRLALQEDNSHHDVTTNLLIHPSWRIQAAIVAKEEGVIAGLPLAGEFLKAMDSSIRFKSMVSDGARVRPGRRLAMIEGKARSILSGERPALNALQHLSGIATFTRQELDTLKGSRARLYDTRKTLPGWRLLQKYAVRCGGAINHRMSLGDAVMIKENHLRIVRAARKDWIFDLQGLMSKPHAPFVQMEIQTEQDLQEALRLKPQRVLLDNLSPRSLKRMIGILRRQLAGVDIEVTGGIKPENLRSLAKLGADRMSMGSLTHSVRAFDCSLDILRVYTN